MVQYFFKRLFLAFVTLFFITFIVYGLVRAMPGSPVQLQEGFNPDKSMSIADRKRMEKYFALDKHWTVGYVIWVQRLVRWGDLGRSSQEKEPVWNSISKRLGPTLQLSITSLVLTYLLAIPLGFNLEAAAITEFVMTFVFLVVILGTTGAKGNANPAGLAIGLCLTLIHLISIPVTNTSVNPARSISQVLFAQNDWAVGQLWLFIVAPIAGAAAAGFFQRLLEGSAKESELQK